MHALEAETRCAHDFVDTAERLLVHASQIHERIESQRRAEARRHAQLRAGMVDIVNDMLDASDPARCATAVTALEGSEARAGTSSERGPAHLSGAALTMAIRQAAKHRDAERQWQKRRVWQVRADCARKLRDKASHWAVNL